MTPRRILYVQYANPAAYPPVENGARLLVRSGARVRALGVSTAGTERLRLPDTAGVDVRLVPPGAGPIGRRFGYLSFLLRSLASLTTWRPVWLYACDVFTAPVALLAGFLPGVRVLYHEHDLPVHSDPSALLRFALLCRRHVARHADAVVSPNAERMDALLDGTDRTGDSLTVANCPLLEDLPARAQHDGPLRLIYHGTIVPERLPMTVLTAMAACRHDLELVVAGYETVGARGYVSRLRAEAGRLGISDKVHFAGPMPHAEALALSASCDVGLAFVPYRARDANMRSMPGASNKVYDYLGAALALLVTDVPDWKASYVDTGLALACDPTDAASITTALDWFAENPAARRRMGEDGRSRVLADWNFETQFQPVLDLLLHARSSLARGPAAGDDSGAS